jgi:antirestriction protein ArdC
MKFNPARVDVYEQITNGIASAIEEGTGKYEAPWHALSMPLNAVNRKPYRGVNVLMLWAATQKSGYTCNEWATYRQWQEAGAQVRKEERSTTVVFWKFYDRSEEQQEDSDVQEDRPRCFARCYHVFNASQVDGYVPKLPEQLPESIRLEHADRFFASIPAVVKHRGDRAFYSPTGDFIQMPFFGQFKSPESYVSTKADEFGHWSGAPCRLNRDLSGRFGDERYSMEELIAELTSSFLCADLQIQSEPRVDHAPYVSSWLAVMKSDKRAIFTAASKAQEAATYLENLAGLAHECASYEAFFF